jgi:hypothetical protein
MKPGAARAEAIAEYLAAGEAKLRDARLLRDEDLRALAAEVGKSEAARRAGVSLSTVKMAVGRG